MKYVKMLGLAAVAAMALMAFVGASTASATVLKSTGVTLGKNAPIEASLKSGDSAALTNTAGEPLDTCTGGVVAGKISNAGGAAATVSGPVESLTWTGCTDPTTTIKGGTLEIHHISGTTDGTVTSSGAEVTVNNSVIGSCIYGTGAGIDIGRLETAGATDVININVVVNEQIPLRFFCPDHAIWDAEYVVTTPHALIVEAS
jgi:hypothetical protein